MMDRIKMEPGGSTPLYRQIHQTVAALIRGGEIPVGTRLPSTREVAARLGVTRATVMEAYAELESDGLVGGDAGRGTFVLGATIESSRGACA